MGRTENLLIEGGNWGKKLKKTGNWLIEGKTGVKNWGEQETGYSTVTGRGDSVTISGKDVLMINSTSRDTL